MLSFSPLLYLQAGAPTREWEGRVSSVQGTPSLIAVMSSKEQRALGRSHGVGGRGAAAQEAPSGTTEKPTSPASLGVWAMLRPPPRNCDL